MKRIWIDITNTPQVNFLIPVIRYLEKKYEVYITARDFSETIPLLRKNGINPFIIGDHKGKNRALKALGFVQRLIELNNKIPDYDVSISMGGNQPALLGYLRRKKSIIFSDNDLSFKGFSYRFGTHFIFPKSFKYQTVMRRFRIPEKRIHLLDGYKEDIYIADFLPDEQFKKLLPYDEFITIRPENLKANYVLHNAKSIVPALFEKLREYNILFIPRYKEEILYARGYNNIFIPTEPLSGLDVCYHTSVMLTGAGSFAREAVLLGRPAVSFFPNHKLLSVDQDMVQEGKLFYSRDVDEICHFVKSKFTERKNTGSRRLISQKIQNDMLEFLESVIENRDD